MDNNTTVIVDHDDLTREKWSFYLIDTGVILSDWRYETRETKRHKFKSSYLDGTIWQRYDQRGNRCEKPTPPQDVIDKALDAFRQSIAMAE